MHDKGDDPDLGLVPFFNRGVGKIPITLGNIIDHPVLTAKKNPSPSRLEDEQEETTWPL
jgi:hypothetical protein